LASKTSENSPSPIGWERAGVRVRGEGAVSSREVYGEGGAGGTMPPRIVLLPGSRTKELKRHLPVLLEAAKLIQAGCPATWRMVLPSDELVQRARALLPAEPRIELPVGGLAEVLAQADLALASSGTVTMECAFFGVPTVVLYKVSWPEYEVGRRIVKIKHIAMPNLLAGESLFPEFVQQDAIPPKIAQAALELLNDSKRRDLLREKLARVIGSLGGPGAARRDARAVVGLLE
ncbi:MAG: hypothetical protein NTW03_04575, partial [Verrucomicrobia bacterium]|nr:hypothetical protein [Verrucomicrobiota bacterium]